MQNDFLPVHARDLRALGWDQPDFILVTPDAYVDHPSFANALIGRYLTALGYKTAILAQPSFGDPRAFTRLGRPRLAFLVSGGNMDSMVNLYTANKAPRAKDAYSPGGEQKRPPRATIVYTKMLRKAFPDVPIVIGGVEASLRRFAHYDYWDNVVKPSILAECPADLLIYGMGELPLRELAEALNAGLDIHHITYLRGTAYLAKSGEQVYEEKVELPGFDAVSRDKRAFAEAFACLYREQDYQRGKVLLQHQPKGMLVQNPPARPLTTDELDFVYTLPYTRRQHPSYKQPVAALNEVQFSLTSSRGCFGSCAFCSIFLHQGRYIQARSKQSLLDEARQLSAMPEFKGYIHDVGGPSANFMLPPCKKAATAGMCTDRRCLAPRPCPNLRADHTVYTDILKSLRTLPGVKKVFVRSGLRYDYLLCDPNYREFLRELAAYHVSGELKVAPEHCVNRVLELMGKPEIEVYERFCRAFSRMNQELRKKQYVLPYLIASHPGATLDDAVRMAEYLNRIGFVPDHVQDFYPTPGSLATCMYYTGLNPLTMKKVYVAKSREDRAMQRALLQFNKPENYPLVKRALIKAGRQDLIGAGKRCLVRG